MLNGLDLFSGIGGISIALKDWVRPVAYCETDPYCQGVLLSKMDRSKITRAPIWDDVRTLNRESGNFPSDVIDIIYGGFPCQDISVAGRGKGLEGERSGLFFEIVRLAKEIQPKFIFLENVPAITSRGGITVVRTLAEMGYDCRWCVISAASIGALHRRERWFLLAKSNGTGLEGHGDRTLGSGQKESLFASVSQHDVPYSASLRCGQGTSQGIRSEGQTEQPAQSGHTGSQILNYWENTEPPVCGIPNGIPHRAHRIRALGNSVVPQQAKEAFEILMGLK